MTETIQPIQPETVPKPKKVTVRPIDIVIFTVIIVIIAILSFTIYNKLVLKHDVTHAQVTADKVVSAIEHREGAAARKLGDKTFQAQNSDASLTQLFKAKEVATLKKPTLDQTIAVTTKNGRTVYFIYKYTALKVPFYVRIGVHNNHDTWQLINIKGNVDETQL